LGEAARVSGMGMGAGNVDFVPVNVMTLDMAFGEGGFLYNGAVRASFFFGLGF
jgi:hypothetical protein